MQQKNELVDYENMPIEQLEKIVANSKQHYAKGATSQQSQEPGFLKSLGQMQLNYSKGALHGAGQALGDIGASIGNIPSNIIEKFTGKVPYHIPHPDLMNQNPQSLSESIGQSVTKELAPFAVPGIIGLKSAQLANKGYKALRAGKELPLIGRVLAGAGGGALEGASTNEADRLSGAKTGALIGGGGQTASEIMNFGKSIASKNIARQVKQVMEHEKNTIGSQINKTLLEGEEAGANQFLKPVKINTSLIKRTDSKNSKHLYGLEKYNQNPTLQNAHNAQSDIGIILRENAGAKKGSIERDAYDQAKAAQNRLLQQISQAFERAGLSKHGETFANLRGQYSTRVGPYLNSPSISKLLETRPNMPKLRPGKFADELLKEETFLKERSEHHPGLIRREHYKKLKESDLAKGALKGVAAVAGGVPLGYAIAKALGLR